jgi:cell division protease FtsH
VRRIITDSEQRAEQLMRDNLDLLHRCSKALMEREILDSAELDVLIRGEELTPMVKDVASLREKIRSAAPPTEPTPEQGPDPEGLALSPT